jgi:hypothetical protein
MMAFNSDAYIANLIAQGFTRGQAADSARYEAQAQAYIAANPTSQAAKQYVEPKMVPVGDTGTGNYGGIAGAGQAGGGGAPVVPPVPVAAKPAVVPSVDSVKATQDLLLAQQAKAQAEADLRDRQSAYDILYSEFNKYGLGTLVEDVKYLLQSNVSPSQFALELQNTKSYQNRFSANQDRIKAGLSALSPKEYIDLEDQYQNVMRNYGLPASYYAQTVDPITGVKKQSGFDKFIAGDVSSTELEDRIATAQQRVLNSNPEVLQALKQFYPDINNADILAYSLDPQNALTNIKRKVSAAEIGGAALAQGLQAQGGTAESLAGMGITKAQAQQGYTNVAEMVPRGSQLADIYRQGPYTQGTAEAEVFGTAGAATAKEQRRKLTALETAQFGGSSGVGALGRDKAAYGATFGQAGQY